MSEGAKNNHNQKSKTYALMAAMVLLFFGPFVLAWQMNHNPGLVPKKTSNHGELISPVQPIDGFSLRNLDATDYDKHAFIGHWSLLYVQPQPCQKACLMRIHNLRQLHIALGKDQRRLQRILLTYKVNPTLHQTLHQQYPQMRYALYKRQQALSPGDIYLCDPEGNVMMRYLPGASIDDIYADIEHLLKASQIG